MTNPVTTQAYCSVAHCPAIADRDNKCNQHFVGHDSESHITGWHKFKNEIRDNEIIREHMDTQDDYEAEEDDAYRTPLTIEKLQTIHIQLSTGGGGDGYKLTYSAGGDLLNGCYYWQDWGTYDEYDMNKEELETVERIYLYGDPSAFLSQ